MPHLEGCLGKYRTPVPEERECPVCRASVEVFARAGQIAQEAVCPYCGYRFAAQPQPVFSETPPEI